MQPSAEILYHIYNRGNNRKPVFIQERNHDFFVLKASQELGSRLDFLAYCLMPNHFHFLVYTRPEFEAIKFSNRMSTLLSSYTPTVQKQEHFTGSLFQQNTKYKEVLDDSYAHICFHYIHQNPLKSKLVSRIEDWPHHSFNEYMGAGKSICNIDLAREILAIPVHPDVFYKESYYVINDQSMSELLKE